MSENIDQLTKLESQVESNPRQYNVFQKLLHLLTHSAESKKNKGIVIVSLW
jgi:hypothetical protein